MPRIPPPTGWFVVTVLAPVPTGAQVLDFNDSAQFAGDIPSNGTRTRAFRFLAGEIEFAENPDGVDSALAVGITDSGHVAIRADSQVGIWRRENSTPTFQKLPHGGDPNWNTGPFHAVGLTDSMVVVLDQFGQAPIYGWDGSAIITLGQTVGREPLINSRGDIAYTNCANLSCNMFVMRRVSRPAFEGGCPNASPFHSNVRPLRLTDSGQVLGEHPTTRCFFRPGKPTLVFHGFVPVDANSAAWIVGEDSLARPSIAIDTDSTWVPIDSVFESDVDRDGWHIDRLLRINDRGEILAVGRKTVPTYLLLRPKG